MQSFKVIEVKGVSLGQEMKKFLLLMLITLTFVACAKRERVMNEYEVLLSTKDTMYVNAWYYDYSIATFTSSKTYVFYDTKRVEIIRIHNPVYVREVKKKIKD